MCGITGFVGKGDLNTLKEMTSTLSYRGPDDEGYHFEEGIGLGFRRLSIIDIHGGRQPMTNEDGSLILIFNGEIYNYKELRENLADNHTFSSCSDTEVILHLYEELGEDTFARLEGMFALAIWDKKKSTLLLARDRLGKKPLYYCHRDSSLIFGSEPKSILRHSLVERRISPQALSLYMVHEFVPTPHSIFEGIHKLEPGCYAIFSQGSLNIRPFWKISPRSDVRMTDQQWLDGLDNRINTSVAKRLVSDVPLGVFLSGGIDSSTVAYYAQKNSAEPIHTYSIGFAEDSYDEAPYARLAAAHLETIHHEQQCTATEALEVYKAIVKKLDEPLADASIIPTFLLSQFAKREITVALGGDGADELFMGYPNFLAHKYARVYKLLPSSLRSILSLAASHIPISSRYFSAGFKINRFLKGMDYDQVKQDLIWRGSFAPDALRNLFTKEYAAQFDSQESFQNIETSLENIGNETLLFQLSVLYLKGYLLDDILVKVDRASMYNSLEVRTPFLDHDLVEYALNMPDTLKIHGTEQKYCLKKIMNGRLPDAILRRSKKGFAIPIADWLRGPFKERLLDVCSSDTLRSQGIFNPDFVLQMIRAHLTSTRDHRKELWTILIFQEWYRNWYLSNH